MYFSGLVLALLLLVVESVSETAFFKEIVTGRCFDLLQRGMSEAAANCPNVVGTFMGAFEGKLDQDVNTQDYDAFWSQQKEMDVPKDGALFWISSPSTLDSPLPSRHGLVRPEDTPAGALLYGLVFCGNDKRQDCPGVEVASSPTNEAATWRGAQSAFWASVYEHFAGNVQGRLVVAVQDDSNSVIADLIEYAAIPKLLSSLSPAQVGAGLEQVEFYMLNNNSSCESSKTIVRLETAFVHAGVPTTCYDDPYMIQFLLCAAQSNDSTSAACEWARSHSFANDIPNANDSASSVQGTVGEKDTVVVTPENAEKESNDIKNVSTNITKQIEVEENAASNELQGDKSNRDFRPLRGETKSSDSTNDGVRRNYLPIWACIVLLICGMAVGILLATVSWQRVHLVYQRRRDYITLPQDKDIDEIGQ